MNANLFSNTFKYIKLIFRTNWLGITIWLLSISVMTMAIAAMFNQVYTSEEEILALVETMTNPAVTAMIGPGYGIDNYTVGAMMSHQMLLFSSVAVAIMSILFVVKNTRTDEEEGRLELLRSLPVGRLANLSAVIIVMSIVCLLLALVVGFGLGILKIPSIGIKESLLYGSVLGITGIFFTIVTSLFSQLFSSVRGTLGYSFLFLGIAYLIRAIGDVSSEFLSLISPLGLILRSQVFIENYWWPIVILLIISLIALILVLLLNLKRDLNTGYVNFKLGRKDAKSNLKTPFALAINLNRVTIISWLITIFVLGVSYGSVFGDIDNFFESSDIYKQLLPGVSGASLNDQFLVVLMSIMAMISSIPIILITLKLLSEETKKRIDPLLVTPISRNHFMASFISLSLIVSVFMLLSSSFGLWIASNTVMDHPFNLLTVISSSIVYLPAIWVMVGITALIIGLKPKFKSLIWIYLGYSFFVIYLGGLFQFPEWVSKLSPFGVVPQIPIVDFSITKTIGLISVFILLIITSFGAYRNRDIS